MIEPHGSGGICHYTYELCQALHFIGVDVHLYTNDNYELREYPVSYAVGSCASSRLKEWIKQRTSQFPSIKKRNSNKLSPTTSKRIEVNPKKQLAVADKPSMQIRSLFLYCELLGRLILSGIRVIHIQWVNMQDSSVFVFIRLAKFLGITVVYTAHNVLPHDDDSLNTKKWMAKCYSLVDKIIVHSNSNVEEILDLFDFQADKVFMIPHGNYGFFCHSSGKNEHAEFLNGKKSILFFGSIQKYKGLDVLLEAFKTVHSQRNDLQLIIAGQLTEYDGKNAQYFKNLIIELGIEGAVELRIGYVPMNEVSRYFKSADVVALPYLKTYQSGVVQLAYSFGKPVIATNTGGLAEVVKHNESGSIVSPGDKDQLASAILDIFQRPEICRKMGRNALELSRSEYSWQSIAVETKKLYQ